MLERLNPHPSHETKARGVDHPEIQLRKFEWCGRVCHPSRSVTTPVFCPTIFSPLKFMEALLRIKPLGGTSMAAQETTIRHDPQTPPADSTTKRIFIGPNGLRAGWRLVIFIAIVMAMS